MELASAELAFVRLLPKLNQIEVVFRCEASSEPQPRSLEIAEASWFALDSLPADLSPDQRRQIRRALGDGEK